MTYEVDGKFTFKTDSQARTVSVSGEISLDDGIRDPGSERRSKRLGKEDFENVYRKENEQILSTAQERVGRVLTPADVAQYKDVTWNPGHLIARMFGGPGELVNLVPMTEYINRDISRVDGRKATIEDSFRVLEREWADALKGRPDADPPIPPKKVDVEIELDYSGNMNSPESITVKYVIDGTPKKRTYENVPPLT
nr:DNA/RNA non-specific endonuclease [Nocardiopsis mwathae]